VTGKYDGVYHLGACVDCRAAVRLAPADHVGT
jgi:hypothetical protein